VAPINSGRRHTLPHPSQSADEHGSFCASIGLKWKFSSHFYNKQFVIEIAYNYFEYLTNNLLYTTDVNAIAERVTYKQVFFSPSSNDMPERLRHRSLNEHMPQAAVGVVIGTRTRS
jgi:hypothetical protein